MQSFLTHLNEKAGNGTVDLYKRDGQGGYSAKKDHDCAKAHPGKSHKAWAKKEEEIIVDAGDNIDTLPKGVVGGVRESKAGDAARILRQRKKRQRLLRARSKQQLKDKLIKRKSDKTPDSQSKAGDAAKIIRQRKKRQRNLRARSKRQLKDKRGEVYEMSDAGDAAKIIRQRKKQLKDKTVKRKSGKTPDSQYDYLLRKSKGKPVDVPKNEEIDPFTGMPLDERVRSAVKQQRDRLHLRPGDDRLHKTAPLDAYNKDDENPKPTSHSRLRGIKKQRGAKQTEEVDWDDVAQYWDEDTVSDFLKRGGKITKLKPRVARGATKRQTIHAKGGRPNAKQLADRAEKKMQRSEEVEDIEEAPRPKTAKQVARRERMLKYTQSGQRDKDRAAKAKKIKVKLGKSRKDIKHTIKDVTPKGYGPSEEIEENVAYLKNKEGHTFVVSKRDTKGMRGKQDKFSMSVVDKKGKTIEDYGSHTSVVGAKKFATSRGFKEEVEMSIDEARMGEILKNVKKGTEPYTVVAHKAGKVVGQEHTKMAQAVPAFVREIQKKYPNAKVSVEDRRGRVLHSEDYIDEAAKKTKKPRKVISPELKRREAAARKAKRERIKRGGSPYQAGKDYALYDSVDERVIVDGRMKGYKQAVARIAARHKVIADRTAAADAELPDTDDASADGAVEEAKTITFNHKGKTVRGKVVKNVNTRDAGDPSTGHAETYQLVDIGRGAPIKVYPKSASNKQNEDAGTQSNVTKTGTHSSNLNYITRSKKQGWSDRGRSSAKEKKRASKEARRAGKQQEVEVDEASFVADVAGIGKVILDGKSATEVSVKLKKMLRNKKDLVSVERMTGSEKKKHFMSKAMGKGDEKEETVDEAKLRIPKETGTPGMTKARGPKTPYEKSKAFIAAYKRDNKGKLPTQAQHDKAIKEDEAVDEIWRTPRDKYVKNAGGRGLADKEAAAEKKQTGAEKVIAKYKKRAADAQQWKKDNNKNSTGIEETANVGDKNAPVTPEDMQYLSDFHKDVYGVRPRGTYKHVKTVGDYQKEIESLSQTAADDQKRVKQDRIDRKKGKAHEKKVQKKRTFGPKGGTQKTTLTPAFKRALAKSRSRR